MNSGDLHTRAPLIFIGAIGATIVVLMTLLAAGVFDTENEVDEDAWRTALERDHGTTVTDWATYRDVWAEQCEAEDQALELFIAISLDQGQTYDYVETNLQYACPDRLPVVDQVRDGSDQVGEACDTPPEARTEDQQRMAEAMGC